MKMKLAFDGGSDLAKALQSLKPRVSKGIQREALVEAAEPMRVRMAQLAPRGNPNPANIKDEVAISNARGIDADETAVAVGPTSRAFYGSFQEFGTSRHAAQPFARPAFDTVAPQSLRILAAVMWRSLAGRGISRSISSPSSVVPGGGGDLL